MRWAVVASLGTVTFFCVQAGSAEQDARKEKTVAAFELVAGPLVRPETPVPLDAKVLSEERLDGGIIRRKLAYHTDSADKTVSAYLLLPAMKAEERRPGI